MVGRRGVPARHDAGDQLELDDAWRSACLRHELPGCRSRRGLATWSPISSPRGAARSRSTSSTSAGSQAASAPTRACLPRSLSGHHAGCSPPVAPALQGARSEEKGLSRRFIGILMLDTSSRFPGDVGNARTWPFPVAYKVVRGAVPDRVTSREGMQPCWRRSRLPPTSLSPRAWMASPRPAASSRSIRMSWQPIAPCRWRRARCCRCRWLRASAQGRRPAVLTFSAEFSRRVISRAPARIRPLPCSACRQAPSSRGPSGPVTRSVSRDTLRAEVLHAATRAVAGDGSIGRAGARMHEHVT